METYNIMYVSGNKLRTTAAIHSFYVLLELEDLANKKGLTPNPFSAMLRVYSENLAKTFFDYCAMICLGEARYGRHTSNRVIEQFLKYGGSSEARERIYSMCDMIDPIASAPALKEVFEDDHMCNTPYGGMSWAELVDTYVKYGNVSNVMFIDMIINKQHNDGTIFSKPCLCKTVGKVSLKDFLDHRCDNSPLEYMGLELFTIAVNALHKAKDDYGLIDRMPPNYYSAGAHRFPDKIAWGFIALKAIPNPHASYCEYCGKLEDECCCDICNGCGEKVGNCCCDEYNDDDSDSNDNDDEDEVENEEKDGIYAAYIAAVGALGVSGVHTGRC